jgi:citrate synthase
LRGFALLARTAGLIGQLAEELRHPVANDIFLSVDLNNRSVAPDPYEPGGPRG